MVLHNIIVAASNLYAFRSIYGLLLNKDYFGVFSISGAMSSSILYHLSEHSKHHMKGFKILHFGERTFLNFDRIFAVMSILYFVITKYNQFFDKQIMIYSIIGILSGIISEAQRYRFNNKYLYMIMHTIWHLCAFHVPYLLLKSN